MRLIGATDPRDQVTAVNLLMESATLLPTDPTCYYQFDSR